MNTICDTLALNSQRFEISDILGHTVVKSRKTVKSANNTICDTCTLNSQRYDMSDILVHTVVKYRKTVKTANNTICVKLQ